MPFDQACILLVERYDTSVVVYWVLGWYVNDMIILLDHLPHETEKQNNTVSFLDSETDHFTCHLHWACSRLLFVKGFNLQEPFLTT